MTAAQLNIKNTSFESIQDRSALPLWKHQKQTAKFAEKKNAVLDFSEAGTGKTRGHLEVFNKRGGRLLVTCPMTLMESAWGEDIDQFYPDLNYSLAYAKNREDAFAFNNDVVIINNDAVKWLAKRPSSWWKAQGFTDLIIDEVNDFKNPSSGRSKSFRQIAKHFKNRTAFTGTPAPNSITEVWHPTYLVDNGKTLGDNYFNFRAVVCHGIEETYGNKRFTKWLDKEGAAETVYSLLAGMTIRHLMDDCMDIPPITTRTVPFTLPSRLQSAYEELAETAALELRDHTITAVHAAALRTKLLQAASGAVYASDGSVAFLDSSRYELTIQLADEVAHSVVFFLWGHQKQHLVNELKRKGMSYVVIDGTTPATERARIRRDFQEGRYRTILLHPKTGAHGLTLTKATRVIFASPVYQADYVEQAKMRVRRGTQRFKTELLAVEAEHTADVLVAAKMMGKKIRMDHFASLFS